MDFVICKILFLLLYQFTFFFFVLFCIESCFFRYILETMPQYGSKPPFITTRVNLKEYRPHDTVNICRWGINSLIISKWKTIGAPEILIELEKCTLSNGIVSLPPVHSRIPYPVPESRQVDWIEYTFISSGCSTGFLYFPQSPDRTNI